MYNKKRGQDMLDSDSEEEGGKKKILHSTVILMIESNHKTHSEVKTTRTH